MEQILRSLLQKQGYEHIGIVNAEKKIWGYSKDGVYHFCCADDLSDIDRKSIGFTDDICVLSIVDDIVVNVEDLSKFATGIVIDNNNFITKELRQMEAIPMNTIQPYYQLKRIKSDSIVIIRSCYIPHDYQRLNRKSGRDWESYVQMRSDHPQFIPLNFDKLDWVTFLVYLDGKCIQDAKLYMYLDEYYFFRTDTSIRIYHSEEGWVFDGCLSYLWDTTSNLYLVYIKEPNIVSIQTIDSCRKQVFDTNDFFKYQFFSKDNRNYSLYDYHVVCSDHYLIIPFSAHNWIFVISDDYYFSAKCIEIDNNSNLFFQNNIIRTQYETYYGGYYNGEFQGGTRTEYNYFDIDGKQLKVQKEADYGRDIISTGNIKTGMSYGVLDTNECKIIMPPVYNKIEYLGCSTFQFEIINTEINPPQKLVGLYSEHNGFIIPIGVDINKPSYNIHFYTDSILIDNGFRVYSIGMNKGLVCYGAKALDAVYDSIDGFVFSGNYFGEIISYDDRRNKEYSPLSVIIRKNGLSGLYSNNVIFEPIFNRISCCMLLEGHAYFEVRCGNKHGVISDSEDFNKISKCIYDMVEVQNRDTELVVKVCKDGKWGMLSSNLNRSIPIKYDTLVILKKCYLGDGKYYSMKGVELLNEDDYTFISDGDYCQAYKNKNNNEFVFICSNGDKLEYNYKEGDNSIIEIKYSYSYNKEIIEFDIKNNVFIENDNDSDDYYNYMREKEERRYYENEGYRDAYDGNPDAQWNTD